MGLYIKQNGVIKPLAGSTPGEGLPVGAITAFTANSIPSGWLLCDGSTFDETLYPALFLALGGNVLPDLRNRFLEGADSVVREYKEAGIPNITASARNRYVTTYLDAALENPSGAFKRGANLPKSSYSEAAPETSGSYTHDESIDFNAKDGETKTDGTLKTEDEAHVYGNSDTVQPASYTVNYIIKATSGITTEAALDAFNMIKDFVTPRLTDFKNASTLDVGAASGALYDFTADEDCFVAISQQWGTGTDLSAWCHLYDKDDNLLAYDGYSGYGLSNAPSVVAGFIFVPKGETIKYRFTQGSGNLQNPKLIVRTR